VDDVVVGYRAFMRWEFVDRGRVVRAARAVDAATHPDHQGQGIFSRLTLHGLDEMRAAGVDFVFNTPNDQSRPGNLKLGWEVVGQVTPRVRPRSPASLLPVLRSRTPARHWGEPVAAGVRADEVFADASATAALLESAATSGGLRTRLSGEYLRWRFDADLLGYRVLPLGDDLTAGVACFRVRRRGDAREATIGEVLVPGGSSSARRRAIRAVLAATGADYALVVGGHLRDGVVPLPRGGPTLVWRAVCSSSRPALGDWHLTMGDIELF